jgi:2-polyprenyl-3-methyl-5-hydroxy-6-metoxy-1,4-benzoquinol methylase
MDSPEISESDLFKALGGLERINRWDFSGQFLYLELKKHIHAKSNVKILDMACARGAFLFFLARKFDDQERISFHGCDINQKSIEYAKSRSEKEGSGLHFFVHDALKDTLEEEYEVILCSLFLHHLSNDEIKKLLLKMVAKAKVVLISDLRRSMFGYYVSIVATRLLTTSRIVHNDGPASIQQALTIREMKAILQELNITSYEIKKQCPFRFMLLIKQS